MCAGTRRSAFSTRTRTACCLRPVAASRSSTPKSAAIRRRTRRNRKFSTAEGSARDRARICGGVPGGAGRVCPVLLSVRKSGHPAREAHCDTTAHATGDCELLVRAPAPPPCQRARGKVPNGPHVEARKAPPVENFAWLPVGVNPNKTGRGSVSLI